MLLAGSPAGSPEDPLATSSGATRGRQRKPSLPRSQLQGARPEGARAEGHGLHDHHPPTIMTHMLEGGGQQFTARPSTPRWKPTLCSHGLRGAEVPLPPRHSHFCRITAALPLCSTFSPHPPNSPRDKVRPLATP